MDLGGECREGVPQRWSGGRFRDPAVPFLHTNKRERSELHASFLWQSSFPTTVITAKYGCLFPDWHWLNNNLESRWFKILLQINFIPSFFWDVYFHLNHLLKCLGMRVFVFAHLWVKLGIKFRENNHYGVVWPSPASPPITPFWPALTCWTAASGPSPCSELHVKNSLRKKDKMGAFLFFWKVIFKRYCSI